jgi:hypothetical protein
VRLDQRLNRLDAPERTMVAEADDVLRRQGAPAE